MRIFSFVGKDESESPVIELVSCKNNGKNCSDLREKINGLLISARKSRVNKEYRKAIDEIKEAYLLTEGLEVSGCRDCRTFFQETILRTLGLVTDELKKMSSGIFRGKHYQDVFRYAVQTVEELSHR